MMNTLLVTGADAGAGKTVVGCLLLRAAQRRGWRTAAFVPCETGFTAASADPAAAALPLYARDAAGGYDPPEIAQPIDVERDPGQWPAGTHALAATARCLHRGRDAIVPYVFADAGAPASAARHAGARILLNVLETALRRLAAGYEFVVVETAGGGLATPVTRAHDYGALAAQWRTPVLVVTQPGDGALNHTALTAHYARARGLDVLGVVVDRWPGDAGTPDLDELERATRAPVLGCVPPLEDVDIAAGRLDGLAAADDAIDWDALFTRWGSLQSSAAGPALT